MSSFFDSINPTDINLVSYNKIIRATINTESRGSYSAFNPNDNNNGISFGIIQFNQKSGTLLKLLERCQEVSPGYFYSIFFKSPTDLIDLDLSGMKEEFRVLGSYFEFQLQQDKIMLEDYFLPSARTALQLGLGSELELAILFDISVQFGVEGMKKIVGYAGKQSSNYLDFPYIHRIATRADALSHCFRRRNIINSYKLNKFRCFIRVGYEDFNIENERSGIDIFLFQNMLNCILYNRMNDPKEFLLKQDGIFGMKTLRTCQQVSRILGFQEDEIESLNQTISFKLIGSVVDGYIEIVSDEESLKNEKKDT